MSLDCALQHSSPSHCLAGFTLPLVQGSKALAYSVSRPFSLHWPRALQSWDADSRSSINPLQQGLALLHTRYTQERFAGQVLYQSTTPARGAMPALEFQAHQNMPERRLWRPSAAAPVFCQ